MNRSVSGQGHVTGSCECGNKPSRLHTMRGSSQVVEDLLASQEGLCSVEFVSYVLYIRVYVHRSSTVLNDKRLQKLRD